MVGHGCADEWTLKHMGRWLILMLMIGWCAAALWFGPLAQAQQNIVTLQGCQTATSATCTNPKLVTVSNTGVISVVGQ